MKQDLLSFILHTCPNKFSFLSMIIIIIIVVIIIIIIMERKLNLFGFICRMKDNMLVKEAMFGTMERESRRGRPCRQWLDDIKKWGGEEIHILNRKAQDHSRWRAVVRTALDTYRRRAHGAMDRWMKYTVMQGWLKMGFIMCIQIYNIID